MFLFLLRVYILLYQVVNDEYTAYLDPVIALVYILVLIWSCVPLVKDSCLILLQTIPGKVVIRGILIKTPIAFQAMSRSRC